MLTRLFENMLSRLNISQRILLGFTLLLLISFSLAALSLYGLKESHQRFVHFKNVSEDANLMLRIDNNIAEMQRAIVVFSNAEKNTTSTAMVDLHAQLMRDIRLLVEENSFSSAADTELLLQMQNALENFAEKIEELEKQRDYRDSLVNGDLLKRYELLDSALMEYRGRAGNALYDGLLKAQFSVLRSEVFVSRYFSSHDIKLRKEVMAYLQQAAAVFNAMGNQNEGVGGRLNNALNDIRNLINRAVQADRNYLFLVNVVIAGESAELRNMSEQLKAAALKDQQRVFAVSDRQIAFYQQLLLLSSILAVLLALIVAVITGKRISRPIELITDTFARLVKGENLQEIPGMSRLDEIGSLAQAATVFRETNARTQALLDKAELLTLELKQREFSLELAVEEAKQASLAKSQFLANMSHELRTPMNAVLGMLTLLRKTPLDQVQMDYALKTESAARSLLSLLNDILDISKAEAGRMQLDPHPFDLRQLMDELHVILSNNLVAKPVRLEIQVQSSVPSALLGDALRLKQVLINLGGNAIKFTDEGRVLIEVGLVDNSVNGVLLKFCVKDSGIGIAPENQARIFQGFTQAEASTTRRFGGTGLGLAISQHLVNMMGGEIQLSSEVGEGSCFYFSILLPRAEPGVVEVKQQVVTQNASTEKNRLVGMRILLAEDNLINQQVACELLKDEGAEIVVAENGQQCIDILQQAFRQYGEGFDAVLMDIQMPVMDGYTATRKIRDELNLRDLPVIAMTANAMESDRIACLDAGMNEHVGKPFEMDELVAVLRRLVLEN
ncbi:MAG: response regulator [Oceanospirillaceae bacterium]|nr:response regulator [Oceanospirillaceae bacterium]MCP5349464.1 response regulator [Oceanospirillaceae bacterium]